MIKASCVRLSFLSHGWGQMSTADVVRFFQGPSHIVFSIEQSKAQTPFFTGPQTSPRFNLHWAHSPQRWQVKLPPASRNHAPDSSFCYPQALNISLDTCSKGTFQQSYWITSFRFPSWQVITQKSFCLIMISVPAQALPSQYSHTWLFMLFTLVLPSKYFHCTD